MKLEPNEIFIDFSIFRDQTNEIDKGFLCYGLGNNTRPEVGAALGDISWC